MEVGASSLDSEQLLGELEAAVGELSELRDGEQAHRESLALLAAFRRVDTNGDGVLSREEVGEWVAAEMGVLLCTTPASGQEEHAQGRSAAWSDRFDDLLRAAPTIGEGGRPGLALEQFRELRVGLLRDMHARTVAAQARLQELLRAAESLAQRSHLLHTSHGIGVSLSPTSSASSVLATSSSGARSSFLSMAYYRL